MNLFQKIILGICALCLIVPAVAHAVVINEIRIDDDGADNDEYFELAGTPGQSLDGYTYLVIGDGAGGSGVIENVTDLTGQSIQADGFLAVHKSGTVGDCTGYDVDLALNFENSDNVTHLLVTGFTGTNGDDLDIDDDGVLDATPWSTIEDSVAFIETVGSGDLVYSSTQVGPDGSYVPGHIFRCGSTWQIGPFCASGEPVCSVASGTLDTPGADNSPSCTIPSEETSWGAMKSRF